jgi:methyl-accepting chemotaxis protein
MSDPLKIPTRSMSPILLATRTLARSAAVLFTLITLVTVSCAGYVYYEATQEKGIAIQKRELDRGGADQLLRLNLLEKKVRADVTRVAEIVAEAGDASNPKRQGNSLSGLEAVGRQFAADVSETKQAASTYGGSDLITAYAEVERRFSPYHASGVALAKIAAARDIAAIDAAKSSFSELGDALRASLGGLGHALELGKQARAAKTSAANNRIDELREATTTMALASCVLTGLACLAGVLAVRGWVVRPLSALTECFTNLAAGDTRPATVDTDRADEIGDLGRAYSHFRQIVLDSNAARDRARQQDALIASERERAAADKERVERRKGATMRRMVDEVEEETNVAVAGLIDLMDHMTGIASEMAGASDRLGSTTASVSSASGEALASMQSASSSTKELSGSIGRVADQVGDAKATSDAAVAASQQASRSIESLSKVASEIDEVTGLIANITRQTSLLALNAGVEAARAGSEGHGFAIIAREIRSLAEQTADATDKIGELIRQVQGSTKSAVAAVDNISGAIDRVSHSSVRITEVMRTQVGTTKVIAGNVDGATLSVTNVTNQIKSVAEDVQSARTLARNVEEVCSEASSKVRDLRTSLVKIVRTSSGEVDRREHPRYEIDREGTIEVGGAVRPVRIVDISAGGAKLRGDIEPSARTFTLNAPGIDRPLRSRVLAQRDDAIHAEFEASGEEQARLGSQLRHIAVSSGRGSA